MLKGEGVPLKSIESIKGRQTIKCDEGALKYFLDIPLYVV